MFDADFKKLGFLLRFVGYAKLVLAAMALFLALTGYDTPKPVNGPGLLVGINLLLLGGLCLKASRAFRRQSLDEGLHEIGRIFGYYAFLLVLAVLGVGYNLIEFVIHIAQRWD